MRLRIAGALLVTVSICACDIPDASLPPEESVIVPADGKVVVYVEPPRRSARPILESFTEQSGVEVEAIYLDEIGDRFYELVKREAAAGRVDLFWGSSPLWAIELQRAGLTVPFRSVGARPIPGQYHDPRFHWTGFAVNPRVLIFNTNRVDRARAPRSVEDFTRRPWAGNGVMSRIRRGPPAFHAAAMISLWGPERGVKFFDAIVIEGNAVVDDDDQALERVVAGDSLWGIIDLDRAICAKRRNEPIHIFFPDRMGLGAITPPWVAALVSRAPNPPQARGLFAYLFSTETAWQMGQFDCALMSLLPDIPRPDWIPTLGGINVTQLDNQAVYDAYHDHVEFFDRWGD